MGNRGRRGRNDWHQRAAEFHDLAAHAHRVAATHRAKKITRPDANFRNKRWNTQPRLTSTHEMLIRNREILSAKHEIRRAPSPSCGTMMFASGAKRKGSRRGAGTSFGSRCVAFGTNSPSS